MEFALVAGPVILILIGMLEFSIVMWRASVIDHAALVLHKEVRTRQANPDNFMQIFCSAAGGLVNCQDESLRVSVTRVQPAGQEDARYESQRDRNGFSASEEEPFQIGIRYRNRFILPLFSAIVPNSVMDLSTNLYGEYE